MLDLGIIGRRRESWRPRYSWHRRAILRHVFHDFDFPSSTSSFIETKLALIGTGLDAL